jgi:hypothetical protein
MVSQYIRGWKSLPPERQEHLNKESMKKISHSNFIIISKQHFQQLRVLYALKATFCIQESAIEFNPTYSYQFLPLTLLLTYPIAEPSSAVPAVSGNDELEA